MVKRGALNLKQYGEKAFASQLQIIDCEQRSDAWYEARRGLITASNFGALMGESDGVGRTRLLHRLAGEIVSGETNEEGRFVSRAMERGIAMEPEIREGYERRHDVEVRQIGFAINFAGLKRCGASPDGICGFDGGVEIKSMMPELLVSLLLKGTSVPSAYRAQVQGNMLVLERSWWDLVIGYKGMPPFEVRIFRDESYLRQLHGQIERFNWDLDQLVTKLSAMKR